MLAKVNDRLAVWRHEAKLTIFLLLSVAKVNDRLAVWKHLYIRTNAESNFLVAKVNDLLAVWRHSTSLLLNLYFSILQK